ncbi:hypothetical protein NL676_034978 [Syzygium grande]|nr:hypothetical protein NL676_034978 [Syzygium grande]
MKLRFLGASSAPLPPPSPPPPSQVLPRPSLPEPPRLHPRRLSPRRPSPPSMSRSARPPGVNFKNHLAPYSASSPLAPATPRHHRRQGRLAPPRPRSRPGRQVKALIVPSSCCPRRAVSRPPMVQFRPGGRGSPLSEGSGINTGNSSKSMAWFTRPKTSNNLQNRITSVVRCRDDGSVAVAERSSTDVAGQVEKVATHQGDCEARKDSNAARSAQPLWLGKIAGTVVVVPLAGEEASKVDGSLQRYGGETWHTSGGGAGQLEWRQGSGEIVASDHSAV